MISPCWTESFSSTRKRTMRPETISGATFTICDSTNPSSVIECVRRSMIQGIKRNSPAATATQIRTIFRSCLGQAPLGRVTGAGGCGTGGGDWGAGEGGDGGGGVWLMRFLYIGPFL